MTIPTDITRCRDSQVFNDVLPQHFVSVTVNTQVHSPLLNRALPIIVYEQLFITFSIDQLRCLEDWKPGDTNKQKLLLMHIYRPGQSWINVRKSKADGGHVVSRRDILYRPLSQVNADSLAVFGCRCLHYVRPSGNGNMMAADHIRYGDATKTAY